MKPYHLFFVALICLGTHVAGAQSLHLHVLPLIGDTPLVLEQEYPLPAQKTTVRISTFRFYISAIRLLQGDAVVYTEPSSYHLVDMEDTATMSVLLAIPAGVAYNHISFLLGIDSATNAAGAQGGDLDPTKGMYWAWQSGFINMKLEGTSPACVTRKHEFQYHLGGFLNGAYCAQQVVLPVPQGHSVTIGVDAATFLQGTNLSATSAIMTPGAAAVALSKKAAQMFHIITTVAQ